MDEIEKKEIEREDKLQAIGRKHRECLRRAERARRALGFTEDPDERADLEEAVLDFLVDCLHLSFNSHDFDLENLTRQALMIFEEENEVNVTSTL